MTTIESNSVQLILASASPRRRELLKSCFINYKVEPADIDENLSFTRPQDLVENLAYLKAKEVLDRHGQENVLVLGADTIVVLDGQILGKPKDIVQAKEMLKRLSGKAHLVFTGVALVNKSKKVVFSEKTQVSFTEITADLLDLYLKTEDSLDKAGAYGIQGHALSFIKSIQGSYSNVVGLPVDRVLHEVKSFLEVDDKDTKGKWREVFN